MIQLNSKEQQIYNRIITIINNLAPGHYYCSDFFYANGANCTVNARLCRRLFEEITTNSNMSITTNIQLAGKLSKHGYNII